MTLDPDDLRALTTVTRTRCPGCGHLMSLPTLDYFHPTDDGTALERDEECDRCDTRVTFRLIVVTP